MLCVSVQRGPKVTSLVARSSRYWCVQHLRRIRARAARGVRNKGCYFRPPLYVRVSSAFFVSLHEIVNNNKIVRWIFEHVMHGTMYAFPFYVLRQLFA
jgi:hypothetical protein